MHCAWWSSFHDGQPGPPVQLTKTILGSVWTITLSELQVRLILHELPDGRLKCATVKIPAETVR